MTRPAIHETRTRPAGHGIRSVLVVLAASVVALLASAAAHAGPFPDRVVEFHPGTDAGFGQNHFPGNVLGPPHGSTDTSNPQDSPQRLLSLGHGGWITLEYTNSRIVNGPGPDFIVFENVFEPISMPGVRFIETAVVAVSQDGDHFTTFTFRFHAYPDGRVGYPHQYEGFAGVTPTLSNPSNGIPPTDPTVAGGDAFDLADVGLPWIRFIRIRDTGLPGTPQETVDGDGNVVNDPGKAQSQVLPSTGKGGFELDAVAAVHWEPYDPTALPAAAAEVWTLAP